METDTMKPAYKAALNPFAIIFSYIIFALQSIHTILFVTYMMPVAYLGITPVMRPMLRFWAWFTFILAGKSVHITGAEKMDPSRNYLLVANHGSYYDVAGIMRFVPLAAWLGRSSFLKIPLISTFLNMIHYIPVYRGDPIRSKTAVDKAIAEASRITIAIFPEGTRTCDGNIGEFKKGFVHIMRGSNLDILPVTLNGFYQFMPRFRWALDPRARLDVVMHDPIRREDLLGMTNDEIVAIVRSVIQSSYRNTNA